MATRAENQTPRRFNMQALSETRLPLRHTAAWAVALFVVDLTLFVLAAYIGGAIVDHRWDLHWAAFRFRSSSIVFIAVWVGMFYLLGLYRRSLALSFRDEFYFTLIAIVLGVTPQIAIYTFVPTLSTSRLALLLSASVGVVLVGSSRSLIHFVRSALGSRQQNRVLVVGQASQIDATRQELLKDPTVPQLLTMSLDGPTVPASPNELAKFVTDTAKEWRCNRILISGALDDKQTRQVLLMCEQSGIALAVALPNLHFGAYELEVERVGNQLTISPIRPRICRPTAVVVKRILDLFLTSLTVLMSLPIMLGASLAVWLESGRPIFFSQARVGRYGRIFKMLKFRTMKTNAGDAWATVGDSRITKVGAILRRLSVDELPQLFNVLRGEMSLVGPRPEMQHFEEQFASTVPLYSERRLALPGITGWAQVSIKRNLSPDDVEHVLRYDLSYIEHWSFFLDLTVLLKTATEFLFHGAV